MNDLLINIMTSINANSFNKLNSKNFVCKSTIISQQLLEQNEDIIAAVVENLQIGRLDDCIQLYSILQ